MTQKPPKSIDWFLHHGEHWSLMGLFFPILSSACMQKLMNDA